LRRVLKALVIRVPTIQPGAEVSRANKHFGFYARNIAELGEFVHPGLITDEHIGVADTETIVKVFWSKESGTRNNNSSEPYCSLVYGEMSEPS
jgi:hypothetical protein